MRFADIPVVKNVVSPASYAKPFALPKLLPSRPKSERTDHDEPHVMISI